MLSIINSSRRLLRFVLIGMLALQACNKEYDEVDATSPFVTEPPTGGTATLNELINGDTTFSILKAAITKAGLTGILSNAASRLTFFAPDNAAFRRSGIPSEAVIAVLPAATVAAIVSYHLTPDYLPADSIPSSFPNLQYPTYLNPAPQLSSLLRLTIFPSRANGAYVNNIPITAANTVASNGVLHRVAAIVAPPSRSIYELITADTSLTFLVAALNRADSGSAPTPTSSLIEAIKSIGANLTLFAPDNDAFRQLLIVMGYPPSPIVFNFLPVTTARALIAYHLLPVRAFSVNMPTTASLKPTLLNSAVPVHPGVTIAVGFAGPFVTTFSIKGLANASAASVTIQDVHATNGVVHKINQVLLPQ